MRQVPLDVGEAIGKLKAVVCLDALYPDAPACMPPDQPFEKIDRGIGGLFRVSGQETQAGELVNGSVLKQAQLRVCDTLTGHDLHIHLNALARIDHLLIGVRMIDSFLLLWRKRPQFAHDPGGGCSRAEAVDATVLPYLGLDYGGAYPRSASTMPLCADWGDCGVAGTGRLGIPRCHPIWPSRSRCTTGFCCTFGWHG